MRTIPLPQGCMALVDDEDYDWLNQWVWSLLSSGYAARTERNGFQRTVYMHVAIMQRYYPIITIGDHEDQNKVNNQKYNLRVATKSQNRANSKLNSNNTTGYRGVQFNERLMKYVARIRFQNKGKHLGLFTDPREAALAYDRAARRYFGAFASLNFPDLVDIVQVSEE